MSSNENAQICEETCDFCSSLDSTPECESSFPKYQVTSPDVSHKGDASFDTHESSLDLPKIDCTDDENASTTEHSLSSLMQSFKSLSSGTGQLPTASKLKELKEVMAKVNEAYTRKKISEAVLGSFKAIHHQIPPQLAAKLKDVMAGASANQFVKGASSSGDTFNILGLGDDEPLITSSLSTFEKAELKRHAMKALRANIERMSKEKEALKAQFGIHCQKGVQSDTLLSDQRVRLLGLYHDVQHQLDQGCQLLLDISQIMQELAHVQQDPTMDLQNTMYSVLWEKAETLRSLTNTLKLKTEHMAYEDKKVVKTMDTVGEKLKTTLDTMTEELKDLKHKLSLYERKEESSKEFKEVLEDYNKIKAQLQHKMQTLSILTNLDSSLS